MRLSPLILLLLSLAAMAQDMALDTSWDRLFADRGVQGVIVTYDTATAAYRASDLARAEQRFVPASTFKVPHTLFALDAGVVDRKSELFTWTGSKQPFRSWERNQTLASAFRASVPWVYQELADRIGEPRERAYLRRIAYGNQSTAGGLRAFWLTGELAISAREQIDFLRRLDAEALPFSVEHQLFVKDLMLVDAVPDRAIRAKSGWAFDHPSRIGWYVGWAEIHDRRIFFALNMVIADAKAHPPLRAEITRQVLKELGGP